tara:strand:+ start:82378 stop:82752 length:375 start_codon:yes stop_codon:yes gene_type:complete
MQKVRENFLIASVICITAGAFFSVANIMSLAGTIGLSGVVLFILGMSIKTNQGLTPEEISNWTPESTQLPDAGRVMYRVDVTLDEPKKCTVLCGPCGHLEALDSDRPSEYICPACSVKLWDEEE